MNWLIPASFIYGFFVVAFDALWLWAGQRSWVHRTAMTSTAAWACGVFGFASVMDNRWLAIPFLLGVYCGNAAIITMKRRSESDQHDDREH